MDGIKKLQEIYEQKMIEEIEKKIGTLIEGYERKIEDTSILINTAQNAIKAYSSVPRRIDLAAFRAQKAAYTQVVSDLESILDHYPEP